MRISQTARSLLRPPLALLALAHQPVGIVTAHSFTNARKVLSYAARPVGAQTRTVHTTDTQPHLQRNTG